MAICIRKAAPKDLDSIYLMGIDVWSDGSTEQEYLSECRSYPKYKKGGCVIQNTLSKFYEKFGFVSLPVEHQQYKTSTCMVRCLNLKQLLSHSAFGLPTYF